MAKVLLTGATGLIGRELAARLFTSGHKLVVVGRNISIIKKKIGVPCEAFEWNDVTKDPFPAASLVGVDHVVHLAGEPIASRRWTDEVKQQIVASRVISTERLMDAVLAVNRNKKIVESVVCASAIGYYGNAGNEVCDEQSTPGHGFLAETCMAWEHALFALATETAPRRVAIRTGVVLALQGGALPKMLPALRSGFGGKLGDGDQWMSWIHIDDHVAIIERALFDKKLKGPINAVAPHPVRNREFMATLAKTLKKPCFLAVPSGVLKLGLGELSRAVLDSQRVAPNVMLQCGFEFKYPTLEKALHHLVGDGAFHLLKTYQWIPKPVDVVFEFFAEAKNLERITPPWLKFHIDVMSTPAIGLGTMIHYNLKIKGIPASWHSHISVWQPPLEFVDEQKRGPYTKWHHSHQFSAVQDGTLVVDSVRYTLPFGALGDIVAGWLINRDLDDIFSFRFNKINEILN